MKQFSILSFLIFFILLFPEKCFADEDNQFITIVNPVRISRYTTNSSESILSQYSVIKELDLAATWLLTYDVLINNGSVTAIKDFDENQEIGLFLEISSEFAEESEVIYNDTGSWHYAPSVFLSGYKQEERVKLVDTLFEKFKETFGHYPTSVGGWWIDSFSLEYMKQKYGITANLGLSDQFSTDGYQVWGTFWSTPFYPSNYHAGIPAVEESVKLDVVTLQWAPRDPLNGYFNSYYSTQDYLQNPVNQDTSYFEKLVRLYAKKNENAFGQIVVGLESDLSPEAYKGEFAKQMEVVKRLGNSDDLQVLTMSEFSNWYRLTFPNLSPTQVVETDDLLGKPIKVIWYQTPKLRIGLTYNYETFETKIFDFRGYHSNFQESYYVTPNKERELSIYIPSYFDEINNTDDVWSISLGKLTESKRNDQELNMVFTKGEIIFGRDKFLIKGSNEVPNILAKNPNLMVRKKLTGIEISPKDAWVIDRNGYVFKDLTDIATRELMRKRTLGLVLVFTSLFLSLGFGVILSKISQRKKLLVLSFMIIPPTLFINNWYQKNTMNYYVSQAEIDALLNLSTKPPGKVLVYGRECLGCEWATPQKPAVFSNKRSYVQRWGKHPIVYNSSVFEAQNQQVARRKFDELNASYIYITKYGDYVEKVPFSPGDLNIEKLYDNANAEIWKVKE
ncbi:hypothetical protein A2715_04875 [Candidatus Woesebacteria bacterium RIFCSPHIGHO2_01_FULL_39_32]|uniref:Uncharacterized protein n=1 Tax=Candidatus Woesebacteria bacterium RIFCSPLOWO2_01_FULL_39_25 TaxID=1802521 RepID=A0A1F8BLG5_9BACT|nr:MAG: hypothetical protein A2124_00840 [Candidatus Woesebacteria bacterium GWB1_37_5]OGM25352.1 MAG: hypothetical protein A2715_04875 [Candidatus Woesebacteria bacterium RIFCSPHIGHO2_01_FULL_39_32]OGM37851.1 MAG: hypothetical protein A3F01_02085 [Candidatus Woesebacteria bacterium RIFCSPHIGHO2_12_FULL_38_11]OGM64883.1 MAG: hypothetical protein A2893_04485 [Candidatus Woesebacteria bacterium RIFCSPLOWO2_01_FULL_39_25]